MIVQDVTYLEQSIQQLNNLLKGLVAAKTGLGDKIIQNETVKAINNNLGKIVDSYR